MSALLHCDTARIQGIACAVPAKVVPVNDPRITKFVGVAERRMGGNLLALAHAAGAKVLRDLNMKPSDVDAVMFVTQTSPRRMPSISCELQRTLGLRDTILAFDVNLACSGYTYGLWIAANLGVPRVLLIAGDVIGEYLDESDKSTYPLFGDAVSATVVEHLKAEGRTFAFMGGTDGSGSEALVIDWKNLEDIQGIECLQMQGDKVFEFVKREVPKLVQSVTQNGHVDWFLFHQANKMMIDAVARISGCDPAKVPMNIQRYGNTSSASIPLLMCDSECTDSLRKSRRKVAMFGFGAGFSYGGVLTDVDRISLSVVEVP